MAVRVWGEQKVFSGGGWIPAAHHRMLSNLKKWGRGGCKGGLEGGGGVGGVYQKWGVVASPVRTPPGEIHRFV